MQIGPADLPILILAGGRGQRLGDMTSDRPKPLVEILGRSFLEWQIDRLQAQGFRRFWISVGYLAKKFQEVPWAKRFPDLHFDFFAESNPLGTGGAVIEILEQKWGEKSQPQFLWVVNGDTLLEAPLPDLSSSPFPVTYLAVPPSQAMDAEPNLAVNKEDAILEIQSGKGEWLDAGALFFKSLSDTVAWMDLAHEPPYSIHEALRPGIARQKLGIFRQSGRCFDMGTPSRLKRLEEFLKAQPKGIRPW